MPDRKRLGTGLIAAALIGIIYYIFIRVTGLSLPCPINFVTDGKIRCPGCGITRLFLALSKGDINGAFNANQCLFVLIPIWSVLVIARLIFQPKWLDADSRFFKAVCLVTLIVLLAFGLLRNIFGF